MDQMLRLLRSKCAYCGLLKLPRVEVDRFTCKLKLIRYGLLQESEDLENIHLRSKSSEAFATNGSATDIAEESDEFEEEDKDSLLQRRKAFVKHALRNVEGKNFTARAVADKVEVVAEQRRVLVQDFFRVAPATRVCGSCQG
jgi:DNA-directed RNA polymerase I subunit RPA1